MPMFADAAEAQAFLDGIRFKQARHFHKGRFGPIDFIVIHSMESSERITTAEEWLEATAVQARVSSVNYGVDSDSECCAVKPEDTAWHAAGVNSRSIGIEHAGKASQSKAEWLDHYGTAMLRRSARLAGALCTVYDVPVRLASVDDVVRAYAGRSYRKGFITHAQASAAAEAMDKPNFGHWDPGPDFPMTEYLSQVMAWVPSLHVPIEPEVSTVSRRVNDPTRRKVDGQRPFQMLSDDGRSIIGLHGSRIDGQEGNDKIAVLKLPTACVEMVPWIGDPSSPGTALGVIAYTASHKPLEFRWSTD